MSNTPDKAEWDDGIDWLDEEAAEAEMDRIQAAMEADRPADAPRLTGEGADDPNGLIADAQLEAFARGVPRWWLVLPPAPHDGCGEWIYADRPASRADHAEGLAGADDGEPDAEAARAAEPAFENAPEPEAAPCPGPKPEPAPEQSPPLNRIVRPWPRQPRGGLPIDDGRMQPFYGRPYT